MSAAPARRAAALFTETFGSRPDGLWWAPGRVNLIGEHTDYNDGFVLPFALGHGVAAAARVGTEPVLRVRSGQQAEIVELPLADVAPGTVSGWSAYVAGVAWALLQDGHRLPGLDLVVDGDVPLGAGLSSSAALECAVALAWNDLAGLGLSRTALAGIARRAENEVVGAPTGVMDQMASLHGREGNLVFLDTRSLGVEHIPFDLASAGLALLVVDSRTPHALVSGEYAERRRSCRLAAERLGVPALRDAALDDLARLDDDLLLRRARHVVTEDARVAEVVAALRAGADPRAIGPLLTTSHASMRDDFEITVPPVDLAVTTALDAGAHGARMTGGGFGGCVIALVDRDDAEPIARRVEAAYAGAGHGPPAAFTTRAHEGAGRLDGA
ncbi:galactokinase [Pseudonocardia sp.]|uniref:galactokinase n=1 Tax=Pseudonocardia sp. TaxID=60912 RepID=UPI003D10E50A